MYLTFAWQAYYFDEKEEPQSILVLENEWARFVRQIRDLTNGAIRYTLLSQCISRAIHERLQYPIPLSEQSLKASVDEIHNVVDFHFQKQTSVVVPVYNLRAEGFEAYRTSMALANAVLHFRGSAVLHGEVLGGAEREDDIKALEDCCVLCVTVSGDRESQRAFAIQESLEALKVLRFVRRWSINEVKQPPYFNPASFVSIWRSTAQLLVFYDPDAEVRALKTGLYAHDSAVVRTDDVQYARQFGGLDEINYHYANAGHPISDQIIRALTYYDKGALAVTNWEALHHYVVSVNVAVLSGQSNKQKLRKDIETLFRHGGGYNRSGFLDDLLSRAPAENWEELVKSNAKPVEKFYRIRSIVTHGGEFNVSNILDTDVLLAREIAHNAVRLIAKLARENQWRDHAEAKAWFELKRH